MWHVNTMHLSSLPGYDFEMASSCEPWRKSRWSTQVICDKYCPGRNRCRPSLQCTTCKSFYHPECIFFNHKDAKRIKDTYTCTRCCLAKDPDALKIHIKTVDLCPSLKLSLDCLLHIFSFLSLTDLCSVCCVCSTWKHVGVQPRLWKRISFNSVLVRDWDMAEKCLMLYNIERLDFRGLVLRHKKDTVWHKITDILHNMEYLKHLDFGQVPSGVLHDIVGSLQSLEILTAEWIIDVNRDTDSVWGKNARIDIGKFSHLKNLKQLRLRAASSGLQLPMFAFSGGMNDLKELSQLKKLALTTFKSLNSQDFEFLQHLKNLEELQLGDCLEWETETYEMLAQLTKLRYLRLENGGTIPDSGLFLALSSLRNLVHLELVMFRVPDTFVDALVALSFLKYLSIWPDNRDEHGPRVNANCLSAVTCLKHLHLLDWGVVMDEEPSKDIAQNYFSFCEALVNKEQPVLTFSKELQVTQSQLKIVKTKQDIGTGSIMISAPQLKIFLSHTLSSTYVRVLPIPINAVQRLYFLL